MLCGEMMTVSSLPRVLTPQMIHKQQKYLLWLQRKNAPSLCTLPKCRAPPGNALAQHTAGCRDTVEHYKLQATMWAEKPKIQERM